MTSSQVASNETPPMSAQDMDSLRDENGLIAGKFKTYEDMAASYKELEGKLGAIEQTKTEETTEGEAESQDWNPQEIYGEGLANVLEEVGIDTQEITNVFEETGNIREEDYQKLGEAGFSKQIIDTYLNGLRGGAVSTEIEQAQLDDILSVTGGEEGYSKLRDWTQKNMPDETLKAFDKILDTQDPTMIKVAVEGFASKMRQAEGFEPSLINGRSPQSVTPFATGAEIQAAMSDPRYGKDEAYTLSVYSRLQDSNAI
tara:strand:- start:285 stop:1055 length:771 start_codon:yes stop_codon:yes gene_type:complete